MKPENETKYIKISKLKIPYVSGTHTTHKNKGGHYIMPLDRLKNVLT